MPTGTSVTPTRRYRRDWGRGRWGDAAVTELLDLLSLPFMQRAVIAGLAIAVMVGLLGVFVVQRGLSFLGDGLAHASFGGIALGAYVAYLSDRLELLQQPLLLALPFTVLTALAIAWVRDHTRLSSDTAIGVFFAVSVALGVLFVSIIPPDRNVVDVWHLLFGSILAVSAADLRIILGVALLALVVLTRLWGILAYSTFDAELARTDGVPTRALEYLLFALAAVIVVVSAQVVGIVLLAAYLVIPAATARLLARSLFSMTLLSILLGVISTLAGLLASFYFDVPSGSTIILAQALLFVPAALSARR